MTNQKRRDEAPSEAGYRGSLPTRDDSLARIWVTAVIVLFLLLFVLNFAGIPSSLLPSPTPLPSISAAPSASVAPSVSVSASASAAASVAPGTSVAPSP